MKLKHYSILFLIAILPAGITAQEVKPDVPNPSFENWEDLGDYDEPVEWNSINSETVDFSSTLPVTKSTKANSGSASVQLETINALIATSPGALTLGRFVEVSFTDRDIRGGIPCNARPESFEGYYQFEPVNNDYGYIGCILFKFNDNTGEQDTIGKGVIKPDTKVDSWTHFKVDIEYRSTEQPDTINFIVTSSYKFGDPQVGTKMWVDDFKVNYNATGLSESPTKKTIEVYPNPASEQVVIEWSSLQPTQVDLLDIAGKKVRSLKVEQNTRVNLETTEVPEGVYFVKISQPEGVTTRRLVITH